MSLLIYKYVKISCDREYAYPEFLEMWKGFINQYDIKEISDSNKDTDVFNISDNPSDDLVA